MAVKKDDIKVIINYPKDVYAKDKMDNIIAKWIFDLQTELYGKEHLDIAYPLLIKENKKNCDNRA